jgi:hypothetical protein
VVVGLPEVTISSWGKVLSFVDVEQVTQPVVIEPPEDRISS